MNKTNVLKLFPKENRKVCPKCKLPYPEGGLVCLNCNPPTDLKHQGPTAKTPKHMDMPSTQPRTTNLPKKPVEREIKTVTLPASDKKKPRQASGILRKTTVVLFSLILLSFLAGSVSWAVLGELPFVGKFPFDRIPFFNTKTLINYVPEDSDLFVKISTQEGSDQLKALQTHWQTLPKHLEWETTLKQLLGMADDGTTSWDRDVRPWLGKEIGLFAKFNNEYPAAIGLLFASEDIEQTKNFMDKLAQEQDAKITTSEYKKILITQIQTKTDTIEILPDSNSLDEATFQNSTQTSSGFLVYLGKTLIVTNSESSMQKVIDTYKTGNNFSNSAVFEKLDTTNQQNDILSVYVNPQAQQQNQIYSALLDLIGLYRGIPLLSESDLPAPFSLLACSLTADMQGLRLSTQMINSTDHPFTSANTAFSPTLPRAIPNDAILYWGGANLADHWTDYLKNLELSTATDPDPFLEIETRLTALAIDTATRSSFGDSLQGEYALAILPGQRLPILALLITPADKEAALAQLNSIAAALAYAIFGAATSPDEIPADTLTKQEYKGVSITSVHHPAIPPVYEPSYALVGDNFIICSHPDCFDAFIQVADNERLFLTRNADLLDYIENIDQPPDSLYYFNKANLDSFLAANFKLMPDAPSSTLDLALLSSDLSPLKSIVGSISSEPDQTTMDTLILLSP